MALTDIEKVRLNVGDRVEPYFVSDDEIEAFLEEYNGNITKTSIKVANCILFYLAANPSAYRERTGEIEVYTTDPYKAYRDALLVFINNPKYNLGTVMPYAAGISKSDAAIYNTNYDNNIAGTSLPNNVNSVGNVYDQLHPCTHVIPE